MPDAPVDYELIESHEMAVERGFRGSPTVARRRRRPLRRPRRPFGPACRIYRTENGPAGSPTLDQLRSAITATGRD